MLGKRYRYDVVPSQADVAWRRTWGFAGVNMEVNLKVNHEMEAGNVLVLRTMYYDTYSTM